VAPDAATLDDAIETIREHRENQDRSDGLTRRVTRVAKSDQRAAVVVRYALAPLLGLRLGRAVTAEYRTDALTELALVILDSPLDGNDSPADSSTVPTPGSTRPPAESSSVVSCTSSRWPLSIPCT